MQPCLAGTVAAGARGAGVQRKCPAAYGRRCGDGMGATLYLRVVESPAGLRFDSVVVYWHLI